MAPQPHHSPVVTHQILLTFHKPHFHHRTPVTAYISLLFVKSPSHIPHFAFLTLYILAMSKRAASAVNPSASGPAAKRVKTAVSAGYSHLSRSTKAHVLIASLPLYRKSITSPLFPSNSSNKSSLSYHLPPTWPSSSLPANSTQQRGPPLAPTSAISKERTTRDYSSPTPTTPSMTASSQRKPPTLSLRPC